MKSGDGFKSKKVLVTGSSGFVGRHYLSEFDGAPLCDEDGVVDLTDARRVHSAVLSMRPQSVLHLAAQSSVASSFEDPVRTFAVNFTGTLNLLQALSSSGFDGTFVYVGSADVYGRVDDAGLPVKESRPLYPRSPYAVSKVAAESLCYQWSQTHGFRIALTRPFNQIGPGQDRRFAIADFAWQIGEIRKGRRAPELITGDLDVTRDFTDIRDTVCAYQMLIERGRNGEVYNICSGEERSLRMLVEKMMEIAGVKAELKTDTSRLRPVEQRRMAGDPRKIGDELGWNPIIPLEQTLSDIMRETEE